MNLTSTNKDTYTSHIASVNVLTSLAGEQEVEGASIIQGRVAEGRVGVRAVYDETQYQ